MPVRKRVVTTATAGVLAVLLAVQASQLSGQAEEPLPDALPYSTSYLVTGDYAAGGVDLTSADAANGFVTGTIHMGTTADNTVPAGADIVAAFVYWESIYSGTTPPTGATFRGIPLSAVKVSPASIAGTPCWATGSDLTMGMFRADVLPYLPVEKDAAGSKNGRRLVNDADLTANGSGLHTITLPQASGNQAPESAGASLVVVYRLPSDPLRKIVVYDGIYILPEGGTMSQNLRGFYQSSSSKSAKLTHLVASGAKNHTDLLTFNGTTVAEGIEPFIESGASADRSWFTKTLGHGLIDSLMAPLASAPSSGYGETATTTVSHTNTSPYECMAWAGTIFSTAVKDVDHDGLPDGLEDAAGTLQNPPSILPTVANPNPIGEQLPNLRAMGASSEHKDLFIEINSTKAANSLAQTPYADHDHMPSPEVLKMVGDAYYNGPLQIHPHFDVGPTLAAAYATAISGLAQSGTLPDDNYIVSASNARGGETILEQPCAAGANCQFPDYPGTVGWKFGFQIYRDARVTSSGGELTADQQAAQKTLCKTTPNDANCRQRFDRIRRDLFHYALYAHARGRPKSTFPCLDASNNPAEYAKNAEGAYTGMCAAGHAANPDFHTPKSISGTADLPGGNLMITLGLWGDAATPFVIASTTLHELGHNLNLWHGGKEAVLGSQTASTTTIIEANCKPNYLSSMSYLYQVHGMFNDEDTDGDGYPDEIPHLGYSGQSLGTISENALGDGSFALAPVFRPAWFAPATSDLAIQQGLSAATKYCNGSKFPFGPADTPPTGWVDMARVTAPTTSSAIDWNGDLTTNGSTTLNVNFDGTPRIERLGQSPTGGDPIFPSVLSEFNDWDNVRLDQIAGSRATGRFTSFEGTQFEGTQFEGSQFEGSQFEGTQFEGSQFEGSQFEGSQFEGSQFEGSQFEGSQFEGTQFEGSQFEAQEMDLTLASSLGRSAPNSLKGCVIVSGSAACDDGVAAHSHRQLLRWSRPTFGTVGAYHVYRLQGAVTPAAVSGATELTPAGGIPDTQFTDTTELPDYSACVAGHAPVDCEFTYFVRADLTDDPPGPSANSNFAKVKPRNDAPVAADDLDYTVQAGETLSVAARGVLINDSDADSDIANATAALVLTSQPSKASAFALQSDGSFSYTPQPGATGFDTFKYTANSGLWAAGFAMSANSNEAMVKITLTDTTPPKVNVTVPSPSGLNGYFNTKPVSVTVTATDPSFVTALGCTDNGSPVPAGSLTLSGLGTQTANGTLSVSAEGTHSVICTATDRFNNVGATPAPGWNNTGALMIDTVQPVSSITSGPAEGAELAFGAGLGSGSSVTFGFAATDPAPASGVAAIECKLDDAPFAPCTSPKTFAGLALGPHTFTVHARDNAGNLGADVVRNFKVVYVYALSPLKSAANIGSAVPINFTLKDQFGVVVNTLTATVPMIKMESIFNGATVPAGGCVASVTGTPEVLYSPATGAAGGSNFRVVSGGYQFNWDSTTAKTNPINTGKGCYTVQITLSDGSNPKLTNAVQLK